MINIPYRMSYIMVLQMAVAKTILALELVR